MTNKTGLYLLLAAGFSQRFGSPKLLHALPSGRSIIQASIKALKSSGCTFALVIREGDTALTAHLSNTNVSVIKVSSAEKGLSSVIAEATASINTKSVDWIGICLADMPYILPQTFTSLPNHISLSTIVRPCYQKKLGHPVLFGRYYFDELSQLSGDDGAKSILKQFPNALNIINVDDPMILHDIDVPQNVLS